MITGGSGLLGQYLNMLLSGKHRILTLYNSNEGNCRDYNSLKINLENFVKLGEVISEFLPEVLIHTAAISRPEQCDKLPRDFVLKINLHLSKFIAEICDRKKIKLIFTSTDLVYDGDSAPMKKENEIPKPVSLYAESKLRSEIEIQNIIENHVILRTSLLYGLGFNHSVNNFHLMVHNFRNNIPVRLFYDQFRTPMSLYDAARLLDGIISLNLENIILNFGGSERVSRAELGEILCEVCNFDKSLILKTSMKDIEGIHKVADVSMNTGTLNSLGLIQKGIEESIDEIFRNETNN